MPIPVSAACAAIARSLWQRGVAAGALRAATVRAYLLGALGLRLPGGQRQAAQLLEQLCPELPACPQAEAAGVGCAAAMADAVAGQQDPAWGLIAACEASLALEVRGDRLEWGRRHRRTSGAFFTPPWLAAYLAARTIPVTAAGGARAPRLLDPAMGAGALLLAGMRRLARRTGCSPRTLVATSIFGVDTDPLAVAVGRVALWVAAAPADRPSPAEAAALRSHLRCGNALLGTLPGPGRWGAGSGGFDLLLANPPWGTRLGAEERAILRGMFADLARGDFNVYTLFLAAACQWVAPGGRAGLIVPEGWLVNRGAEPLRRRLLAEAGVEEVAVLRKGVFADAPDTVPVVVVLRPGGAARAVRVRVYGFNRPIRPEPAPAGGAAPGAEEPALTWSLDYHADGSRWAALPYAIFPVARNPERTHLYRQVEALGQPLAAAGWARFTDGVYKTRLMPLLTPPDPGPGPTGAGPLPPGHRPALVAAAEVAPYTLRWRGWSARPQQWTQLPAADQERARSPKLVFHALKKPGARQRVACALDPGEGRAVPGTGVPGGLVVSNNFVVLLPGPGAPDLGYLMALFNSTVLNQWYSDHFIQVNIEAFTLGAVPIRPASRDRPEPDRLARWLEMAEAGCREELCAGVAARLREVGSGPVPAVVHDLIARLAIGLQARQQPALRRLLEDLVALLYGLEPDRWVGPGQG